MKHIFKLILFAATMLLMQSVFGQVLVPFAGTRPTDTSYSARSLRVDSVVRLVRYSSADSNKVLGVTANGTLVLRTKSTGTTQNWESVMGTSPNAGKTTSDAVFWDGADERLSIEQNNGEPIIRMNATIDDNTFFIQAVASSNIIASYNRSAPSKSLTVSFPIPIDSDVMVNIPNTKDGTLAYEQDLIDTAAAIRADFPSGGNFIADQIDTAQDANFWIKNIGKFGIVSNPLDTIYIIGDSYTTGSDASGDAFRFSTVTSRRLGLIEKNLGIAGAFMQKGTPSNPLSATNMIDRLNIIPVYNSSTMSQLHVALGLNDVGWNGGTYTAPNFSVDYRRTMDTIIARGWPVSKVFIYSTWYITTTGYNTYSGLSGNSAPTLSRQLAYNDTIESISNDYNVQFVDIYNYQSSHGNSQFLTGNGIHPNNTGHQVISDGILSAMGNPQANIQNYGETYLLNATRINSIDSTPFSLYFNDGAIPFSKIEYNNGLGKFYIGNIYSATATSIPSAITLDGSYANGDEFTKYKFSFCNQGSEQYAAGVSANLGLWFGVSPGAGVPKMTLRNNTTIQGSIGMGVLSGSQTAPTSIAMDASYATTPNDPAHAKIRLLDLGSGSYGISVSVPSGQEYFAGSQGLHTFYGNVITSNGGITSTQSFGANITTITTTTTLDATHYTILVDASGGNVTVNLPAAATCTRRIYNIKLISATNSAIIDGNGSETIDGATTATLLVQYLNITIQSNGTNWSII